MISYILTVFPKKYLNDSKPRNRLLSKLNGVLIISSHDLLEENRQWNEMILDETFDHEI